MNIETVNSITSINTAKADAAYLILSSVYSYLIWMCPLNQDSEDAMQIVSDLKREPMIGCTASAYLLTTAYVDKWRELYK